MDFSLLFETEKLKIKLRATIEVDEKGTVAAAATAVVMMLRCMPAPPVHITIDRPFLFLLHKKENILFAGRVVNPQ